MDTIDWTIRKARKEHKCNYCGLPIPVGKKYIHQTLKNDDIYTWKSHEDCHELIEELGWFNYSFEGFTHDDFIQCVHLAYKDIWHIPETEPVSFEQKLNVLKQKHLNYA